MAALLEVGPIARSQQRPAGAKGAGRALGPQPGHPRPGQGGEPQAAQGDAVMGPPRPPEYATAQVQFAAVAAVRRGYPEPGPDRPREQRRHLAGVGVDPGGQGERPRAGAVLLTGPTGPEPAVGQGAQRLADPLQARVGVHRHRPGRVAEIGRVQSQAPFPGPAHPSLPSGTRGPRAERQGPAPPQVPLATGTPDPGHLSAGGGGPSSSRCRDHASCDGAAGWRGNSRVPPGFSSASWPLTPTVMGAASEAASRTRRVVGVRCRLMPQWPR